VRFATPRDFNLQQDSVAVDAAVPLTEVVDLVQQSTLRSKVLPKTATFFTGDVGLATDALVKHIGDTIAIQDPTLDATGNLRVFITRVVSVDATNDLLTVSPEIGAAVGSKIYLYQFNQCAPDIGPLESNY
jgi:hypothetical protein